jgi:hypothetical protein
MERSGCEAGHALGIDELLFQQNFSGMASEIAILISS